jgi:hypothetical protein
MYFTRDVFRRSDVFRRRRIEDPPNRKEVVASSTHIVTRAPQEKACAGECSFRCMFRVGSTWKDVTSFTRDDFRC